MSRHRKSMSAAFVAGAGVIASRLASLAAARLAGFAGSAGLAGFIGLAGFVGFGGLIGFSGLIGLAGLSAPSPALAANDRPEIALPEQMPSASDSSGLFEFYVSPTTTNRFAVDLPSLAIDKNRIIRLMLVVTSSSGVRNVSYDAIDCAHRDYRLLAIGRPDGSWTPVRNSPWRFVIGEAQTNVPHTVLHEQLCAGGATVETTPEKLRRRLQRPADMLMP